ncbi:MAG: hypothetical protein ABFD25_18150 [Clostridiaceae bacterium]
MQEYYVVRQPPFFGGPTGGLFGPFQGMQFMPPGQGPGFPPGQFPGFPGQGPGFPGQGPGGVGGMGPPSGPPPSFTPSQAAAQQTAGVFAVNPGAIRPCRFKFTYIWLDNGRQFWAWITFVGRNSVAGFRWTGFGWVYFGIDIDRISSFICY